MNKFYFTFGSHPDYPYYRGWVEVIADTLQNAVAKFRRRFPDKDEGIVNCAFWYTEKDFKDTIPHGSKYEVCHEVIY